MNNEFVPDTACIAFLIPQTTTSLCMLTHHLLICEGRELIAGFNVSLKRQEPTRLSQSKSPSPLCEDISTLDGK